jgi:hypothetical protein
VTLVDDARRAVFVSHGSGYSPYGEVLADTWRFDLETRSWSSVEATGDIPPGLGSLRAAGRAGSGSTLLFGGYDEEQGIYDDLYQMTSTDTGIVFTKLEQDNPPPGRALHVFAHDPDSGRYVVFGGVGSTLRSDTWWMTLESGTNRALWQKLDVDATGRPSARFGAFFGLDPSSGRLFVFGGQTSSQNIFAQDTWALDLRATPPVWTKILDGSQEGSPPGRRNGTGVLDPSGPRLWVFGGTSDGTSSQPGLFALDLRSGKESWTLLTLEGEPVLRSSGFGAVAGDDVWLGFGNSITGVYRDFSRLGYELHARPCPPSCFCSVVWVVWVVRLM